MVAEMLQVLTKSYSLGCIRRVTIVRRPWTVPGKRGIGHRVRHTPDTCQKHRPGFEQ